MCPFSGTLENIDVTVCGINPLIAERSVTGSKSQKIVFSLASLKSEIFSTLSFSSSESASYIFSASSMASKLSKDIFPKEEIASSTL